MAICAKWLPQGSFILRDMAVKLKRLMEKEEKEKKTKHNKYNSMALT